MRMIVAALVLAAGFPGVAKAAALVEVMVLGSYHFGNPGHDLNNMKADSVLTPQRQAELDAVATAIMAFRPTCVMVEMQSDAPDFAVAEYPTMSGEKMRGEANEIVQIGYRIARRAGLLLVSGIDERPKAGEPDYFPYDAVDAAAKKFGQEKMLAASNADVGPWIQDFEARQKVETVAQLLTRFNTPDTPVTSMAGYYAMLPIGDADSQTGADLNAMWYLRNAKIFGKLMHVAKPGDRVLVVYGSGHSYWLRHFARETPGYRNVDPLPYLARAQLGTGAPLR
jgi:hypothetical protein